MIAASGTWTPLGCVAAMNILLGRVDELVIEEFRLYGDKAMAQTGSSFKTSQLIGALKLLAHNAGVPVVEQGAGIKKPTRSQLPRRGVTVAGDTLHARDAELHLWYRVLRSKEPKTVLAIDPGDKHVGWAHNIKEKV